jgi:hypothetical protein
LGVTQASAQRLEARPFEAGGFAQAQQLQIEFQVLLLAADGIQHRSVPSLESGGEDRVQQEGRNHQGR